MYAGTPNQIKNCPICGSTSGKCRERGEGSMILCMGRPSEQAGTKVDKYVFKEPAKGGDWGIWVVPNEEKGRLQQLTADRIQIETAQPAHDASHQERHETYDDVLSQLSLAPPDLADLEARGLSRAQITEAGFKTAEQWQTLQEEVNWRIPGINPTGRSLYVSGAGYLCPVRDIDGYLVGMQIRLRQPPIDPKTGKPGGRYRWLSSKDKRRVSPPILKVDGELPLSVIQPEGCDRTKVWLVEGTGPKPVITSFRYKRLVIGASGAQWAGSPRTLKRTLDRLKVKSLVLAPDAGSIQPDEKGNQHTLRRYTALNDLLRDWGYTLMVAWWGQDFKPQTQTDKRMTGDIDEISSRENFKTITFDELRQKAAQALQNRNLEGKIQGVGKAMPDPKPVPEPEPMPEDAPIEEKLQLALEHWMVVEGQGNPLAHIPLRNSIRREYSNLTNSQFDEMVTYLRSRDRADSGLTPTGDILVEAMAEIEQRAEGVASPGIPSGFYDLDAMTQGFQPSDFVIVAGRPSMGKTAYCLGLARSIAAQKLPIAIFSLEMSRQQLVYRLLSSETSIETSRLRTGRIMANEWEPLANSLNVLSEAPIFIDDTPNIRVSEIRAKSRRLLAEQGALGCVLIDYLQLIEGIDESNRSQELSRITRALKGLARELNCPVITLSQLSRGVEARTNKRPMMSDLRDSGAIEQDADLIMMLYREEYYDPDTPDRGLAEIIITKHRNGPTGTVKLLFEPQFTRFRNLAGAGA